LIEAGLKEPDAAKRDVLAAEFQREFYKNPPTAVMGVLETVTALNANVQGYTSWLNGMTYWAELKPKG
jgi:ABC-type transport system substrate-binding protein